MFGLRWRCSFVLLAVTLGLVSLGARIAVPPALAVTPSGAITPYVTNGDFTGTPSVGGTIPGWTGSGTLTTTSTGQTYVPNVSALTSTTLALDYSSTGAKAWFRIGYRLHSSSGLTVSYASTQVFSSTSGGDPANT